MIKDCGGEVVKVKEWDEISKNIYTTGEIKGTYKGSFMPEQAVILKTENGITILTGCAHPGIIEIINIVKNTNLPSPPRRWVKGMIFRDTVFLVYILPEIPY